jgi:hypothetical protein
MTSLAKFRVRLGSATKLCHDLKTADKDEYDPTVNEYEKCTASPGSGSVRRMNSVTIPKLAPAPFKAQKMSGFCVAEQRLIDESASTTSTSSM